MPLPWKKNKVARISRFVNDLQSPKRGGSLVVQTGFPTSLVDLFVKNRDHLKKHSKKSKCKKTQTQIEFVLEDATPPPPPPPPPSPPPPPLTDSRNLIVNSLSSPSGPRDEIIASQVQKSVVDENFGGGSDGVGRPTRNGVLVAVLKMFLIMVLALSTKTLAVGVTMSAIVLLLLEYVGVGSRPLLCHKARSFLVSFFRLKKNGLCEESGQKSGCELVGDIGVGSSSEEIQVEEVEIVDQGTRCLNLNTIGRILEEELKSNKKNDRSSRRAKIREKFVKRLVPKKLRGSKKVKEEEEEVVVVEARRSHGHDKKLCRLLEQEQEQEQDNENESSMVLLEEEEGSSRGGSLFSEETQSQSTQRVERETKDSSSSEYLILILIALAGLVGGRIVAIVLALGWCLMLKLVGKSRPVSC